MDTARFDGKPVLFTRVDDGIHKPEELIKKIAHGEVPVFHAEGGAAARTTPPVRTALAAACTRT